LIKCQKVLQLQTFQQFNRKLPLAYLLDITGSCVAKKLTKLTEIRGWRYFTKHKPHTGHWKGQKMTFFVPGDLDLDL